MESMEWGIAEVFEEEEGGRERCQIHLPLGYILFDLYDINCNA